ncbi:MAG: DALR domain-containing protein, partial [Burkholderiaceae bacterium]
TGKQLARVWMHNGFVRIDNEKMSKSLGNFFTIREVLDQYDAETVRFFIVRAHYRSALNYSDAHLDDARQALKRLYLSLAQFDELPLKAPDWGSSHGERFKAAMNEDFATPEAIAVLFDLAAEVNRSRSESLAIELKALGGVMGLLQQNPAAFLQAGSGLDEAAILRQIEARQQAKLAKDYALADQIRQALLAKGVLLKDSAQGTVWERV